MKEITQGREQEELGEAGFGDSSQGGFGESAYGRHGERKGHQVNGKCSNPHRLQLAALERQKGGQRGWSTREGR